MNKEVTWSLGWGIGVVVLALVATYLRKQGHIDPETVNRLVMGATGLMVAAFGNRMPKKFVPNEWARRATRVGGWSMTVSGLIYAGLWAFAPPQVAVVVGSAAVILGIAVTSWYCMSLRARAKTP
jgi:hypothetical protein